MARLLGVHASDLVETITTCKVSARGEVISKTNNTTESRATVNALAMGLYSRNFETLLRIVITF